MAVISSIQIDTSQASKSIADLEKELAETNEQLKQVDINSDAFNDLQKKAAAVQGQLNKINENTATLSKGLSGFGENLAKTTSSISGGITAATAAMQMMGVENENVVNGIAKLQQLMSFTQGISALKDLSTGMRGLSAAVNLSSKSFKGLKGAIAATGIGALLVVLGLVIENWDKIIAKVNEFIDVANISEKVTAGMAAAWEGLKQSIVAIGNAITTYITTPFKTITAAIKAFSETEGDVLDKLKAAMKASKSEIVDAGKNIVSGFKEVGTKAAKAYNNSIDEQNKKAAKKREAERAEELKKAAEHYEKLLKIREEQLKREELTEKQKAEKILEIEEDRLKNTKILYGQDSLEYETQLTKVYNALQNLKNINALEQLTSSTQGLVTETKNAADVLTNLQVVGDNTYKSFSEKVNETKNALNEQFDVIGQTISNLSDSPDGISSAWTTAFSNIQDSMNTFLDALAKGTDSAATDWLQVAATAATAVGSVLNTLADEQDTTTKEGFEQQKKYQYAATIMNAAGGVMNAWTSAMNPANSWMTIWGQIAMGASTSAAILALMGVQLAKIKQTKFDGSGASTSSVSSASLASTITTPTQYSTAVENANLESTISDSRVYVVESDIQQTGSRVNVQETENRY